MYKISKAFELFDAYNQEDPVQVVKDERAYPATYFYSLQLYDWIKRLQPDAGEVLLLASRCQHIGRWQIPRAQYPEGKAGYIKWRTDLRKFHANKAAVLLQQAGYSAETIKSVQRILLKEHMKTDPEVQTMEDALCLVFLQFQYDEFISKHEDNKVISILKKSWLKMSPAGREAALTLSYSGRGKELLEKALQKEIPFG